MKKIQLLKTLQTYPLFTFNDFIRITRKPPEYARTVLYRMRKDDLVNQIIKGKYTVHEDPLIFASFIFIPSYISFWTALRYYGLTEQLPREIMIVSPKSNKKINFKGVDITFTKIKHFWGYKKERYNNFDIFIAEKEKAVIDCLLVKKVPFDEIIKAIRSKELDVKKLIEFAIRTKNKSLVKRLGYILEHFNHKCNDLLELTDNNYICLDSSFKKSGPKDKKWKMIVNRRIE